MIEIHCPMIKSGDWNLACILEQFSSVFCESKDLL